MWCQHGNRGREEQEMDLLDRLLVTVIAFCCTDIENQQLEVIKLNFSTDYRK
jgi:hypothetical protein